jgi:hypothetical protein
MIISSDGVFSVTEVARCMMAVCTERFVVAGVFQTCQRLIGIYALSYRCSRQTAMASFAGKCLHAEGCRTVVASTERPVPAVERRQAFDGHFSLANFLIDGDVINKDEELTCCEFLLTGRITDVSHLRAVMGWETLRQSL